MSMDIDNMFSTTHILANSSPTQSSMSPFSMLFTVTTPPRYTFSLYTMKSTPTINNIFLCRMSHSLALITMGRWVTRYFGT